MMASIRIYGAHEEKIDFFAGFLSFFTFSSYIGDLQTKLSYETMYFSVEFFLFFFSMFKLFALALFVAFVTYLYKRSVQINNHEFITSVQTVINLTIIRYF